MRERWSESILATSPEREGERERRREGETGREGERERGRERERKGERERGKTCGEALYTRQEGDKVQYLDKTSH